MQSNKNLNILLGILAVIILGFVFVYTSGSVDTTVSSGLQADRTNDSGEIASFLRKISAIKDVRLDVAVFDNPVLRNGLRDDSRELLPEDKGRQNPFAPINDFGANVSNFSNEASQPVQNKKVLSD